MWTKSENDFKNKINYIKNITEINKCNQKGYHQIL